MINYRGRRQKSGLSVYTVARELGVDYNKYVEVEQRLRPLEAEYLDKFLEIMKNSTEIKFKRAEKMVKVREEIADGSLRQLMKNMGYNMTEVGKNLKLNATAISNNFNINNKNSSDDTRERIYDFLHDPFNKKIIEEKKAIQLEMPKSEVEMSNYTEPIEEPKNEIGNALYIESNDDYKIIDDDNAFILSKEDLNLKDIDKTKQAIIDSLIDENNNLRRQINAYVKLIERL